MRFYGRWAGNKTGTPEDPSRCIVQVPQHAGSYVYRQCSRKRGHGVHLDLCGIHARKEFARGRSCLYIPPEEES